MTEPHALTRMKVGGELDSNRFVPQDFEGMFELVKLLAQSNVGIPDTLKGKPADMLTVVLQGAEWGLSPMKSLQNLHNIKGKVTPSAQMLGGMVLASPECEYLTFVKGDNTACTFTTKRAGSPEAVTMEFTLEDARSMGLLGKDNWKKNTVDMLRARCLSRICRTVYPDVVAGIYSKEEVQDMDEPVHIESEVIEPAPKVEGGKLDKLAAGLKAGIEATSAPESDDLDETQPVVPPETVVVEGDTEVEIPAAPAVTMDEADEPEAEPVEPLTHEQQLKLIQAASENDKYASLNQFCIDHLGTYLGAVSTDEFDTIMDWIENG